MLGIACRPAPLPPQPQSAEDQHRHRLRGLREPLNHQDPNQQLQRQDKKNPARPPWTRRLRPSSYRATQARQPETPHIAAVKRPSSGKNKDTGPGVAKTARATPSPSTEFNKTAFTFDPSKQTDDLKPALQTSSERGSLKRKRSYTILPLETSITIFSKRPPLFHLLTARKALLNFLPDTHSHDTLTSVTSLPAGVLKHTAYTALLEGSDHASATNNASRTSTATQSHRQHDIAPIPEAAHARRNSHHARRRKKVLSLGMALRPGNDALDVLRQHQIKSIFDRLNNRCDWANELGLALPASPTQGNMESEERVQEVGSVNRIAEVKTRIEEKVRRVGKVWGWRFRDGKEDREAAGSKSGKKGKKDQRRTRVVKKKKKNREVAAKSDANKKGVETGFLLRGKVSSDW